MKHLRILFLVFLAGVFSIFEPVCAQPAQTQVTVLVSPDHMDWKYDVGEPVVPCHL